MEKLPGRLEFGRLHVHFNDRSRGGELETVLSARHAIIDADAPLLIAASNVYVESDIVDRAGTCDLECRAIVVAGRKVTGKLGECWTRLGEAVEVSPAGEQLLGEAPGDRVMAIGDEQAGGNLEAAGTYYFARARDFLDVASDLQKKNVRVRGELRMHSAIDVFLRRKWRVEAVIASGAWPLRSYADVAAFEEWGRGARKRVGVRMI